jgi:hypothetical protein
MMNWSVTGVHPKGLTILYIKLLQVQEFAGLVYKWLRKKKRDGRKVGTVE